MNNPHRPLFVAGDRALCVMDIKPVIGEPVPKVGRLYYVLEATSEYPQFLILKTDEFPDSCIWDATRFALVRPRSSQSRMPLD